MQRMDSLKTFLKPFSGRARAAIAGALKRPGVLGIVRYQGDSPHDPVLAVPLGDPPPASTDAIPHRPGLRPVSYFVRDDHAVAPPDPPVESAPAAVPAE